jgi:hypothetical protein
VRARLIVGLLFAGLVLAQPPEPAPSPAPPAEQAEAFLNRLEQAVGTLKLRDVPPEGKVFVTRTQYLNTAKLLPGLLQPRQHGIELPGAKTPAAQAADE